MEPPPRKKSLWMLPFAIQMSRGLIRDQNTRRRAMFFALLIAMLMMFAGFTFLQSFLSPRQNPGWFLLYWLSCAWLTMLAALLAIFDLIAVRIQARTAAKLLRKKYSESPDSKLDREP